MNVNPKTLREAASFIKSASTRIAELEEKDAANTRFKKAYEVGAEMVEKGLIDGGDLVATVEKLASGTQDLDVLSQAVSISHQGIGISFTSDGDGGKTASERGSDAAKRSLLETLEAM